MTKTQNAVLATVLFSALASSSGYSKETSKEVESIDINYIETTLIDIMQISGIRD